VGKPHATYSPQGRGTKITLFKNPIKNVKISKYSTKTKISWIDKNSFMQNFPPNNI
jgi:hypothetical protein